MLLAPTREKAVKWTAEEKQKVYEAVKLYHADKNWKRITNQISSKTNGQVRAYINILKCKRSGLLTSQEKEIIELCKEGK